MSLMKKILSALGIGDDRGAKRIPTNIAIKYRKASSQDEFQYTICKNVSMLGVYLEDLDSSCLEGDRRVLLEVPHPSGSGGKTFLVEGQISHHDPAISGKPNKYDCGVEFITKQMFDTKMIKDLVSYMSKHRD